MNPKQQNRYILGFLVIWAIIYSIAKNKTQRLNEILKQKQQTLESKENALELAKKLV